MAARAQSDEIDFAICSEVTSRIDVVNFEFVCAAAVLATPTVPLQYLTSQEVIRSRI